MRLAIFDLDGVLVEAKKTHYDSLNLAIEEVTDSKSFCIEWKEHLAEYDGLKTTHKLSKLTVRKGLEQKHHKEIWRRKQEITVESLKNVSEKQNLTEVMEYLKAENFLIACCSNSIRKTVYTVLNNLKLFGFMDLVVSNEDVRNSKPHPEMYWSAMSTLGVVPRETIIIEDSPVGILAAHRSGATVLRVKSPSEVTVNRIKSANKQDDRLDELKPKWSNKKMNVLIPMAGAGSRFAQAGYTFPKPLIEVHGKPMIQVVVENIGVDANYIFVVQKEHREKYNLDTLLKMIAKKCSIIEVDKMTEGAACTALLAKDLINNDEPLFFANSDQFVEWDSCEFMYKMQETSSDGGIVVFESIHPKWSFAKVDDAGIVTEVAEKNPISNQATVGYYYWKKGSDFVKYAEQMIEKNIRVNNEFYVCPVFNQAIEDKKEVRVFKADKMWGLGTPNDLEHFLKNFSKKP